MNKESALSVARNDLHLSFSQRVGFGGFGFAGCKTNQFFLLSHEKRCSQDELGNKKNLSFSQRVGFRGFGFAGCKTNHFFMLNYEKRCSQDELGNKKSYCVKESEAIIYIII
ncbi:MAG: hypothetical protein DRH79_03275 [Candidatus Cloacimonadota bacterium]|nr:MAG: hypothetical protein DRH79_03275 [Candidatus Cloacimonadota bacterium]